MEGDFLFNQYPRPGRTTGGFLRFLWKLLDTPDSMSLPYRGCNLGGFLCGILPYAGHLFQQFRLFGQRGYRLSPQSMIRVQNY